MSESGDEPSLAKCHAEKKYLRNIRTALVLSAGVLRGEVDDKAEDDF